MAGVCFRQSSVTLAGDFAAVRISGVSIIARCPQGESDCNDLGLGTVKRALETKDQLLPSTSCILEAVEICLNSNQSVFNENSIFRFMVLLWDQSMPSVMPI